MVSVMSHELEEAVSDPLLNAWYDSNGEESADKCAWTFGTTYGSAGREHRQHEPRRTRFSDPAKLVECGRRILHAFLRNHARLQFGGIACIANTACRGRHCQLHRHGDAEWRIQRNSGVHDHGPSLPGHSERVSSNGAFTVSATSPASGTFPFTITGTSGSLVHSVTASLVISQPPAPTFTISVSPTSQSVGRGKSVTYLVTITPQNGFSGLVTLTAGGGKTGVTLALNPTSVTASGTSTLTASTTVSARTGNSNLAVTGTYKGTSGSIPPNPLA